MRVSKTSYFTWAAFCFACGLFFLMTDTPVGYFIAGVEACLGIDWIHMYFRHKWLHGQLDYLGDAVARNLEIRDQLVKELEKARRNNETI